MKTGLHLRPNEKFFFFFFLNALLGKVKIFFFKAHDTPRRQKLGTSKFVPKSPQAIFENALKMKMMDHSLRCP